MDEPQLKTGMPREESSPTVVRNQDTNKKNRLLERIDQKLGCLILMIVVLIILYLSWVYLPVFNLVEVIK
jgi:hypothetical protein